MRTYIVEIKATITERIEVDALNEDLAVELASAQFNKNLHTGLPYSEEIVDLEDVSEFRRKVA